jgi:Domain of unknown function (DUF929)
MAKGKQSTASAAQRREQQRQQRQNRLEGAQAKAAVTTRPATPPRNQRKRLRRGWNQQYMVPIVVALIVVIIGVFVLISHLQSNPAAQGPTLASAQVFNAVTHVGQSELDTVGTGGVKSPFQTMKSSGSTPLPPLVGPTGKPEFLYIGAEYCPYCAAQRWAMAVALSRFGTFSQLYETTSSSSDIYPSTPTFTFLSSLYKQPLYTSQYIDFVAVETLGNVQNSDGSYPQLQKLTSAQQQIFNTYDAPPYTAASTAGSIPFIDVANKFLAIGLGSGFSAQDLQGMQWSDIASSLSSTSSTVSQHILGTANYITAAICIATNQQPASVCSSNTIQNIEKTVNNGTAFTVGSQGTLLAVVGPPDVALRRNLL